MSTRIKILIVEHDPNDIELIQYELKKGGINYISEILQTEEEYCNALKNFIPDIILSDYSFPSFSGLAAFEIKERLLPLTPFIFVSGTIGEENSIELIKNGVTDFTLKDNLFTLPLKVKRALEEAKAKLLKIETDGKLRKSEAKFRQLMEASTDVLIGVNKEGEIVYVNKEATILFGYSADELLNNKIEMLLPGRFHDSHESYRSGFQARPVTRAMGKACLPLFGRRKDGSEFATDISLKSIETEEGLVVMSVIRDITEKIKAEEYLKQSEAHLAEAQRLAKMGSWNFDLKSGQLTWSEELYNVFGTNKQTFSETHNSFLHLIDAEDREFALQTSRHTQQTGEPFTLEYRITTPKGEKRVIQEHGYGVKDEKGIVTRLFGTAQNITERKLAEEERLRLSSILEATSDFVGITDVDQRILFLNKAGRIALGFGEREDLPQTKISDCSPAWANEIILKEGIPAALKNGKWAGETAFLTRSGIEIPVSQVIIVHTDSRGELQYLSTITRDISAQKESEQKLKKYAEELKNSNIELERFAYVASHDLQEPLRMVSSFMGLLQKKYNDKFDDTARSYIRFAVDGAERMKKLIHDLLLFSRADTHKEAMQMINCNELMEEVQQDLLSAITESKASVRVNPLPNLRGYKSQLQQLFQNLIGNAIKYRNEKLPLIEISCEEKEKHWQFCVQDNGIGIDPKFFQKIFIIFQRLHHKDDYSGTGIGLAIARKIVERHGGTIWVESEPGQGSSFYFTTAKKIQSQEPAG